MGILQKIFGYEQNKDSKNELENDKEKDKIPKICGNSGANINKKYLICQCCKTDYNSEVDDDDDKWTANCYCTDEQIIFVSSILKKKKRFQPEWNSDMVIVHFIDGSKKK